MANLIVVVVMVIGDIISQKCHKFITYKTFQLHKYLSHSCNGFILIADHYIVYKYIVASLVIVVKLSVDLFFFFSKISQI